jgi:hypothetical protein
LFVYLSVCLGSFRAVPGPLFVCLFFFSVSVKLPGQFPGTARTFDCLFVCFCFFFWVLFSVLVRSVCLSVSLSVRLSGQFPGSARTFVCLFVCLFFFFFLCKLNCPGSFRALPGPLFVCLFIYLFIFLLFLGFVFYVS